MEAMVPTWKSGTHRTGSSVCLSGDNHETMAKEGAGGMFFRKRLPTTPKSKHPNKAINQNNCSDRRTYKRKEIHLPFGAGDVGGGRRWWRM